ncbi:addiction module antidote protein [Erwinia amylovora]
MKEIIRSERFSDWLNSLRDTRARARILMRIDRMKEGNFGDAEPVGDGLSEARIHYGPGYRVYFMQQGERIVVYCVAATKVHNPKILSWPEKSPAPGRRQIMTEQFSQWDSAEYLKNEEDMAEYLNACMEEAGDDPAFIARALGTIARARGMTQVAREAGVSRESLYRALSGNGNPEFGTILKVVKALGLRLHTTSV